MYWFPLSRKSWGRLKPLFSLFCACLILLSSCASNPQTVAQSSNRITIGTTGKPRTLDPADAYELSSISLISNMSDRLYAYEPGDPEVKPDLATALPKVSEDGLTYTIPIRKGVVFHDGTSFNAEAMAFSIKRFIQNKGKPSFLLGDVVKSVEATGEYELTIQLKNQFAAFPALLAFPGVCALSPEAYKIGEGQFNPNNFVGTGAYKLARYGSDLIRFDVFDRYWGKKPKNQGVNVQILSSGVNLYNAFRKQAVDIAYLTLDPDQVRSLQQSAKKGKWDVIPNEGNVISFWSLNRNQPPLDRIEVRQAIAAMVNREVLSERVLYGQADPLYSLIPTGFDVYKPVFQERYGDANTDKAKELLKQAGFTKDKPAVVEIWYPSGSAPRQLTAMVLKALAKKTMGGLLEFDINTVEGTTFFKNNGQGLYPTTLVSWYPDFLDPDNYTQPFLACQKGTPEKGCEDGGSQTQGSFYYSDRINKLIEQERKTQDPVKRKQIFAEIQEQVARDVPYIPLWQNQDNIFAQKNVKGALLDPTQNLIYKNLEK
ncbi:ABC transporter substrate-binding protein [Mastigocoleus testarum]|uniref:Peptide ABC transporter substrate-binding protein n=1 Tax=Mastigocoleus testarum BC008 TaxID=371196 RepID=A0A0V7ZMP7_9CYAN|nr:ABC transporter substrate-binding protein [Mastigocoleus testarum]KST65833.1 peptide ABC transporter substrate-binding protein [Mastigocoleus testarum BC008]